MDILNKDNFPGPVRSENYLKKTHSLNPELSRQNYYSCLHKAHVVNILSQIRLSAGRVTQNMLNHLKFTHNPPALSTSKSNLFIERI